jgi:enamine deaminase RidA (YjgF/YER057c/UK114 family)
MTGHIQRENLFPAGLSKPTGHWTTVTTARPGKLVFISGLTAKNERGNIVGVGDVRAQTRQVCDNLAAAMRAAGGSLGDILRVDVYIKDMGGFKDIHEIRREYFGPNPPASTMVAVAGFTHPDMLIEINAIAALP